MPIETRQRSKLSSPGPFLAEITNHLDPTYMGSLEVSLIKTLQSSFDDQEGTFVVRYLSPFAGATSIRFEGNNSSNFNDVQKSYGMWMVPPDIGTVVMVIFIDGDPNQGYWFGCVQDTFQNHMIPGIAASKETAITKEQMDRYGTSYLPVGEFLKATQNLNVPDIDKIPKPVHPFADRLVQQGLLLDVVRGVTSSSARREAPSSVFGISTPGPLDTSPGAKTGTIGYETKNQAPVSRKGGSTFVMDDGDENGQNELVRIRTRTGHQILLHNTSDLIYIANAQGTAWLEITGSGKLDIFATDSISVHSEADFNFRANRDINLEAGRNIHMRAIKNMETNIGGFNHLVIDDYSKISVKNGYDLAVGDVIKMSSVGDFNISSGVNIAAAAASSVNIIGGDSFKIGSGGVFGVDANGDIILSASNIHLNGPAAPVPAEPMNAETPPLLTVYSLPNRDVNYGWGPDKFYNTGTIKTIMQRVPTHEPWPQHENVNIERFSAAATDVTLQTGVDSPRAAGGVAPNPNAETQQQTNQPDITPGTCDPKYAQHINLPKCQAGIKAIKDSAAKFGITNPYMIATMLGVAGGESLWTLVVENFNYQADRLLEVFPSVFKGDRALAQKYAGNPNNSLPEFLYGYQTAKGQGLGNKLPGDGLKYVGRGYIGLTGRGNYTKFSKLLFDKGLVNNPNALLDNPEMVNDPSIAGAIVALYFLSHPRLQGPNKNPGPGYFEEGYKAVGFCTPDIYAKKKGYYECFLGQLQAKTVGTGTGGILTDSSGNPIKTGS